MLKRLAMVAAVALMAGAGTAAAQDILPPENPYDPSGCNEYHRTRETLDALGETVPNQFQTGEIGEPTGVVVADPLFDMLSLTILWNTEVFPCK